MPLSSRARARATLDRTEVYSHRGLRSLGLIMALGTGCIYLAAVTVLRPLLLWKLARRKRAADLSASNLK